MNKTLSITRCMLTVFSKYVASFTEKSKAKSGQKMKSMFTQVPNLGQLEQKNNNSELLTYKMKTHNSTGI